MRQHDEPPPQPSTSASSVDGTTPPQLPEAPVATDPKPPVSAAALTAEEQMALFEQDLKEHDWGHQPC